mmetsp:Transcript_39130/g.50611  ORF Transcript_39130/g.50611 Transcript_39130/m.50611 type:complete len:130 (+) Transcript_39130:276-665(+)
MFHLLKKWSFSLYLSFLCWNISFTFLPHLQASLEILLVIPLLRVFSGTHNLTDQQHSFHLAICHLRIESAFGCDHSLCPDDMQQQWDESTVNVHTYVYDITKYMHGVTLLSIKNYLFKPTQTAIDSRAP